MKTDVKRARGMVLGQAAINWAVTDRLLGPKPETTLDWLSSLSREQLHAILTRNLAPEKQKISHLVPQGGDPANPGN